jgi:signal transduction histidine kinase
MRRQNTEANPAIGHAEQSHAHTAREEKVFRLLIGGFALITLLGLDAFVGFRGAQLIRESLSALSRNQISHESLIDEIQRTQRALDSIQSRLSLESNQTVRPQLQRNLAAVEQTLRKIFARIPADNPDMQIWREIEQASSSVTAEAARILARPSYGKPDLTRLLNERERLTEATAKLVRSSSERTEAAKREIENTTRRQSIADRLLLTACLVVACLFLRAAARVSHRLSEQSKELNLVSWQLLEKQELLARRLARELHDELGQSLTALKTNFSRHSASSCVDPSWMLDCTVLLKDSIRSAHEISQLLHPTLLDDFGLDTALAWMCERFEERNAIQVRYKSDFHDRLDEQTETHIFRIAQEALTNVARHARASSVFVTFSKERDLARLRISDNGIGLAPRSDVSPPSFGLTGMKARARSLQGEMDIRSGPGQGTAIEVAFPVRAGA